LDRVTPGALITVSVADAGAAFVAPSALVNAPAGIVLRCAPSVTLVTSTVIVQVAPAPRFAGERNAGAAGAAVTVPAPHVVDAFGVAAIVTPAGSESASATPVSATDPRQIRNGDPQRRRAALTIDAGVNVLLSVTPGALITVSVAGAGLGFVAPCVLVSAPAVSY